MIFNEEKTQENTPRKVQVRPIIQFKWRQNFYCAAWNADEA